MFAIFESFKQFPSGFFICQLYKGLGPVPPGRAFSLIFKNLVNSCVLATQNYIKSETIVKIM